MTIISKAHYLEILIGQLGFLHSKENTHPDDLKALVDAIEDAKNRTDFDEVEVIQNGKSLTLKIVEKNNE